MTNARRELIEGFQRPFRPLLVEDVSRRGVLVVRGEFARAGVPTANRRVYTHRLFEREFERLREAIARKTVSGELNHPKDGRADMFNTSHLLTGLTITPEGLVIGEAEILEDLPGGKVIATIYRRGGRVGVSSRGFGSTAVNEAGDEVVQEDYQLVTFDFVSDPADQYAYPELVTETSTKRFFLGVPSMHESTKSPTVESVREEMAARMVKSIAEVRATAEKAVVERFLKNPASIPAALVESIRAHAGGGAPAAALQENVALKATVVERDAALKAITEERDRAVETARVVGYRCYVERVTRDDPDAQAIVEAVGDVTQYENAAALKARIEEVKRSFADSRALAERAERHLQIEREQLAEERATVEDRVAKTEEALNKTLAMVRQLTVDRYRAEAVEGHPRRNAAGRLLDIIEPSSVEEVDAVMEEFRPRRQAPDQTEAARARARQWLGGHGSRTRNSIPLHEEQSTREGRGGGNQDYYGLGVGLSELRNLSGIGQS